MEGVDNVYEDVDEETTRRLMVLSLKINRAKFWVKIALWGVLLLALFFTDVYSDLSRMMVQVFAEKPNIKVQFRCSAWSNDEGVMMLTNKDANKGHELVVTRQSKGRKCESYDVYLEPGVVEKELGYVQINYNFFFGDKGQIKVDDYLLRYKYHITKAGIESGFVLPWQELFDIFFAFVFYFAFGWLMEWVCEKVEDRCIENAIDNGDV